MLMSEAIRLGAMLRPQCQVDLFGINGGSCAIGAGMEALGLQDMTMTEFFAHVSADATISLTSIWIKNDLGYTREAIADWLVESGNDFEVSPLPKIEVCEAQEVMCG